MSHLSPDPILKSALNQEAKLLTKAQVPLVTVSATFHKELLAQYPTLNHLKSEAVFSRAHYSMAEAIRQQALNHHLTTHLVDPTNFVSKEDWPRIKFTETMGKVLARSVTLQRLKDTIDTHIRNKLPLTEAITPPLIYLTDTIRTPIISLHYEAGNILARQGHQVIQVVTDPHVRPQYLDTLPPIDHHNPHSLPQITFAVFDNQTKKDFITLARDLNKDLYPKMVKVSGSPIDPRITKCAKTKQIHTPNTPLHIGITTGGLGTNFSEIKTLLSRLSHLQKTSSQNIKLFLYAGLHSDFRDLYESFAQANNLRIGDLNDPSSPIRILYEDSIIDANNNLIKYLFPWAHLIITKPSGDMAYDATASGCAQLFLSPWGEWEENIQNRFIKWGLAKDLNPQKADKIINYLLRTNLISKVQTKTKKLPAPFYTGAKNILALHQKQRRKLQ